MLPEASLNSFDSVSLKGEGALKSCLQIQLSFDVLLGHLHIACHLLRYLQGFQQVGTNMDAILQWT